MSFIYIFLTIFSSIALAVLLRIFKDKRINIAVAITSNYITAGFIPLILAGNIETTPVILLFGVIIGVLFFVHFLIFGQAVKIAGIASTVTFGRLSLAIPITLSILLWGEKPTWIHIISLILSLFIIASWEGKLGRVPPILLALFVLAGSQDSALKFFKVTFPGADNRFFLVIVFFSAMIVGISYILISRQTLKLYDMGAGLILGIPNFLCCLFMLKSLEKIPAYIVFPFFNTGMILFSALIGYWFFSEELGRRKLFLIGLAFAAVLGFSLQRVHVRTDPPVPPQNGSALPVKSLKARLGSSLLVSGLQSNGKSNTCCTVPGLSADAGCRDRGTMKGR